MINYLKNIVLLLVLLLPLTAISGPEINSVTLNSDTIAKFTRLELSVTLSATFNNPYDYNQVRLKGYFTSPSGQLIVRDGFYMQDYLLLQSGILITSGPPGWRIRFSPDEAGTWTFHVRIWDATGLQNSSDMQFFCTPSERKGFVTRNGNRLVFSNGETFHGLGTNLAFQTWANGFTAYEGWIDALAENGGDFTKLTIAPWIFDFEWKQTGVGQYTERQTRAWALDWVMDMLMDKGIYCQLNTMIHDVLRPGASDWGDNPYNLDNGGPCHEPQNFFVNVKAMELYKRKLRYINARWGFSPQIVAWEVLSEADNTGLYDDFYSQTLSWSNIMTEYINDIDIYNRPVSNGYAIPQHDPGYWDNAETGFTQQHIYDFIPDLEMKIYNFSRNYMDRWNKPYVTGEFALGHDPAEINALDPQGIAFHNVVWASMFSGSFGSAMSWWWDNYLYPNGLFDHLKAVSDFYNEMDEDISELSPTVLFCTSDDFDMIQVDPDFTNDNEKAPENYFTFDPSGLLLPTELYLGEYLYGSFYNSRRNPPTFKVNYPEDGHFKVKVGDLAVFAKLRIRLDGNTVFNQNVSPNSLHSFFIPAGEHEIKVDNSSTGIMKINEYEFHEYAPTLRTFAWENETYAAGWMQNRRYNWDYINQNGTPDPVSNGKIYLDFENNGTYEIRWYNRDIYLDSVQTVVFTGEKMIVDAPDILWDGAFEVKFLAPLEVAFYADPIAGDVPLTVQFTDASQGFGGGIDDWSWDFGDGQTSNQPNPQHTYNSEGNYTVSLTISSGDYSLSLTKENFITAIQPLVAEFISDTTVAVPGEAIHFTDLSLGDPASWLWAFGDNALSFARNPSHTYQQAGSYTVALYVQNPSGNDIESKANYIRVITPVAADFTVGTTLSTVNGEIQFTDLSTGNPDSWFWEFGDSTTSTMQNPLKAYETPGTYTVKLKAWNEYFQDSILIENLITILEPLTADFDADIINPWQGEQIQFTDISGGLPDQWSWDFGDGIINSVQNPVHAYSNSGFYSVTLDIADTLQTGSVTRENFIRVRDTLDADFMVDTTVITIDERAYFTDQSKGNPTSWFWIFGDGFGSALQNPSHKFKFTGDFNITLKISRGDSTNMETRPNVVKVIPNVVAGFTVDTVYAVPGEIIHFSEQSTGNPTLWIWDFGDGTNGFGQNTQTSYQNPGNYTVSLVASNAYISDTVVKENLITILEPVTANFSLSPFEARIGQEVHFNDLSTGSPDRWEWWPGNGDTLHEQNPEVVYQEPGTYEITLIAANDFLSDTLTMQDYLYVLPPPNSQSIPLKTGWSGISTWVRPVYSDISNLFEQVSGQVFFAFNTQGIYSPALNINTIGNWNTNEGLIIYMNDQASVEIQGYEANNGGLDLSAGWSMMPVFNRCNQSPEKYQLMLGDKLKLIREIGGYRLFWPSMGINTLDSISPGRMYEIYLNEPAQLTFPACD